MSQVSIVTNNPLMDLYSTASQAGLGVARKLLTSLHTRSTDFWQRSRIQVGPQLALGRWHTNHNALVIVSKAFPDLLRLAHLQYNNLKNVDH
jgi:hypothetical protein